MTDTRPSDYFVKSMTTEAVDRVFPLLRAVAPALGLDDWRAYFEALAADTAQEDREEAIIAVNSGGYVKGLCICVVRGHRHYGRLLDAPVFVVASAADSERVAAALLGALQAIGERSQCSGIRFWTMGAQTWERRRDQRDIGRTDHGVFLPARAPAAEAEAALALCMLAAPGLIDRPYP